MKTFYVSSYGKNDDKGIYIMKFDEQTLEMKRIQQIVTQDYPSYMIIDDHVLYVAYKNASSHSDGGGLGSFSIYNDELILNNNYSSSGRSYTHLCEPLRRSNFSRRGRPAPCTQRGDGSDMAGFFIPFCRITPRKTAGRPMRHRPFSQRCLSLIPTLSPNGSSRTAPTLTRRGIASDLMERFTRAL